MDTHKSLSATDNCKHVIQASRACQSTVVSRGEDRTGMPSTTVFVENWSFSAAGERKQQARVKAMIIKRVHG